MSQQSQPKETIQSLQAKILQQTEAMLGLVERVRVLEESVINLMQHNSKQIQIINQQTQAINEMADQIANPQVWEIATLSYSTAL